MLDQETLKQIVRYEPETGNFYWLSRTFGLNAWRREKECETWNKRNDGRVPGTIDRDGYRIIRILKKSYRAHRLAWLYVYGKWPTGLIDHKDRNPDNNRIDNLRIATNSQNCANSRDRQSASGIRGVYWVPKHKHWRVQIKVNGKSRFLGAFDNPIDARAVYERELVKQFGEFAPVPSCDELISNAHSDLMEG